MTRILTYKWISVDKWKMAYVLLTKGLRVAWTGTIRRKFEPKLETDLRSKPRFKVWST